MLCLACTLWLMSPMIVACARPLLSSLGPGLTFFGTAPLDPYDSLHPCRSSSDIIRDGDVISCTQQAAVGGKRHRPKQAAVPAAQPIQATLPAPTAEAASQQPAALSAPPSRSARRKAAKRKLRRQGVLPYTPGSFPSSSVCFITSITGDRDLGSKKGIG